MRVRLEVTKGPAAGRSFEFDRPDVFVFGRGEDARMANARAHGRVGPVFYCVMDYVEGIDADRLTEPRGLRVPVDEAGLSGLTREGTVAGSFWFMPREQIIRYRRVRPTTDVYAAGAMLCYLLTGIPVRRGLETAADMPATINAILSQPVVPICERDPSVPEGLAAVIDAAIRDEEPRRYRDAGMMLAALGGPVT